MYYLFEHFFDTPKYDYFGQCGKRDHEHAFIKRERERERVHKTTVVKKIQNLS
jgi:hypothetical protein